MSQRTVIAKVTTKPGARERTMQAFQSVVDAARDEPGTLSYRMYADRRNPEVIWFFEEYADKAGLETHLAGEALQSVSKAIADDLAGPPEMAFLELAGSAGK